MSRPLSGNYGFIPHTLSGDGDPVDVIVVGRHAVMPGAVLRARPVGVLLMEDEAGEDEKILAVPVSKLHPYYAKVQSYEDLEKGKWVRILGWDGPQKAADMIVAGIERAKADRKTAAA